MRGALLCCLLADLQSSCSVSCSLVRASILISWKLAEAYVAEERDGGGRLAPRSLKPAEKPSVSCHWLSWRGPPLSPCASLPAVGTAIRPALRRDDIGGHMGWCNGKSSFFFPEVSSGKSNSQ